MATPAIASDAYARLARLADPASAARGALPKSGDAGASSFGSMLKEALGSVMEAGRKSDAQGLALASGKANVVDVVTAVAETEVAVETLVSVRDRVIQAYEEIMRMPI
jgi:flagellar hook-basal body complex protein FliE